MPLVQGPKGLPVAVGHGREQRQIVPSVRSGLDRRSAHTPIVVSGGTNGSSMWQVIGCLSPSSR